MPIFFKLLISILVFLLLPLLLILGWMLWMHKNETYDLVMEHLHSIAAQQANRAQAVQAHTLENLALLTSRTQLRLSLDHFLKTKDAEAQKKMNRIIGDAKEAVKTLREISILSPEGRIVASTEPTWHEQAPYPKALIQDALTRNRADRIVWDSQGQALLRSSGPLYLEERVVGAIIVDSELHSLAYAIRDYSGLGQTGETLIGVKTPEGALFVFEPRFQVSNVKKAEKQLLESALRGETRTFEEGRDYRSKTVIGLARPIEGTDWGLVVKIDEAEAFASFRATRNLILAIGLPLLVFSGMAAFWISRSLGLPIARLAKVSRQIRKGELAQRSTDDNRTDEIGDLAGAFNEMAQALVSTNQKLETLVEERTEELEAANKELSRSNRDLEQFASIASHDLQTPVRNVTLAVDFLRRNIDPDLINDKVEHYLHHLEEAGALMQSQIEGLLALSRVNSRGGKLTTDINTEVVLDVLIRDLGILLEESGAKVEVETPLPRVFGDEVQIRQVFQNLIENGIKYQKAGEQPVICISATTTNGLATFSVADNGIGIPPEFREKVFEIFKRLHHRREYEGTGLGLALCQKIVQRHGGEIWVETNEEIQSGTVLRFTIPTTENHP